MEKIFTTRTVSPFRLSLAGRNVNLGRSWALKLHGDGRVSRFASMTLREAAISFRSALRFSPLSISNIETHEEKAGRLFNSFAKTQERSLFLGPATAVFFTFGCYGLVLAPADSLLPIPVAMFSLSAGFLLGALNLTISHIGKKAAAKRFFREMSDIPQKDIALVLGKRGCNMETQSLLITLENMGGPSATFAKNIKAEIQNI